MLKRSPVPELRRSRGIKCSRLFFCCGSPFIRRMWQTLMEVILIALKIDVSPKNMHQKEKPFDHLFVAVWDPDWDVRFFLERYGVVRLRNQKLMRHAGTRDHVEKDETKTILSRRVGTCLSWQHVTPLSRLIMAVQHLQQRCRKNVFTFRALNIGVLRHLLPTSKLDTKMTPSYLEVFDETTRNTAAVFVLATISWQ